MKKENEGLQAASFRDCTGLIPAPPQNEAEMESYEELYPFLPSAEAIKAASKKQQD